VSSRRRECDRAATRRPSPKEEHAPDRQLLEALGEVVRTTLTNYFNHLVGTELDLPPAPELDEG
jgi:hypothetical protein